jgi:hypothetical protein
MKLNTDRVALIAGSTGIVGRNLAALLLEQGWNVTAQMFLQTSGDVAVLGECRLIESFTSPVEHKSLAELLYFERPGNRFSGVPNASRLPAKAQGCRHALLSKRASV